MCTSVPQIEAILTRISTSSAVGSGTGTCRTSVLLGTGLSFTAAFIVATMDTPQCGRYCADAAEVFQSCVISLPDSAGAQANVVSGATPTRPRALRPTRERGPRKPRPGCLPEALLTWDHIGTPMLRSWFHM